MLIICVTVLVVVQVKYFSVWNSAAQCVSVTEGLLRFLCHSSFETLLRQIGHNIATSHTWVWGRGQFVAE